MEGLGPRLQYLCQDLVVLCHICIFFFIVVVAVEIQNESVILQSLMGSELNRIFISFIYHYHYFFSKAGMS